MELKDLSKPLTVDQIEFRIQSINKGGYATILAYKDARCDMQRLDDACGPLNWKREHSRDNHNCTVLIYNKETNQWVGKEDTGTESNAEAQKGLASDSFKRACFNWGIGRELYDYPVIQVKLNTNEFNVDGGGKAKPTWNLRLRDWRWHSEWESGKIIYLSASYNDVIRFEWGENVAPEKELPQKLYEQYERILKLYDTCDMQAVADSFQAFKLKEEQAAVWKLFNSKQRSGMKAFTETNEYKRPKDLATYRILNDKEHAQFLKDFNING